MSSAGGSVRAANGAGHDPAAGAGRVEAGRPGGKSPAVQAPGEAGTGDNSWQAVGGRVSEDGAQHPEAGRSDRRCAVSDPQRYVVVFEHSPGMSYGAWVPDLPGVIAAADTREECEQLIREAIALHLAGMREDGEPIPEPTSVDAAVVDVSAA